MRYFIESVATLSSTGKSRKGALLQTIVKKFEHTVIGGDQALTSLLTELHRLVDAVNVLYPGKKVYVHSDLEAGHIYANTGAAGSEESYIFSIGYAPIGEEYFFYDYRNSILATVENIDNNLKKVYEKGGEQ